MSSEKRFEEGGIANSCKTNNVGLGGGAIQFEALRMILKVKNVRIETLQRAF